MLEFRNIQMDFKGQNILSDVNGEFQQGQLIAITGQNGAGKTTLLRILSGLQKPTSGSVYLFNKDIFSISNKRLAKLRSYIPAEHLCHWDMVTEDIVSLGLLNSSLSEEEKDENIYNCMKNLNILNFKGRNISSLSSGEKSLVYLARTVIANPDYIFADELLSNLHKKNQHKIMTYLKALTTKEKGVVLVTHNTEIAKEYCDYIYNLDGDKNSNISIDQFSSVSGIHKNI